MDWMIAKLGFGLITVGMFAGVHPVGGAEVSPFADAIAVWHMADSHDSAGKPDRLTVRGDVKLGIVLEGREREESQRRGGDGWVAQFNATTFSRA